MRRGAHRPSADTARALARWPAGSAGPSSRFSTPPTSRPRALSIAEAQADLAHVIEEAHGAPIALTRGGQVVAHIQPVDVVGRVGARVLGGMRGTATMHDDLIAPLNEP